MNKTKEIDLAEINHEEDLMDIDYDPFDIVFYDWGFSTEDVDIELVKETVNKIKEEFDDSAVDILKKYEDVIQILIKLVECST